MLSTFAPTSRPREDVAGALRRSAVWLCVAATVRLRLPFLQRAPGKDEAGFLIVGQQWHLGGGTSLYGSYWVDRPPLLITVFRFAALSGGLVPLRLVGCLAAALVVVGCAHVAGRLSGDRAARWAAATAAAFCVSPLLGGLEVNGELLAAPLVVGGNAAALAALRQPDEDRAFLWAVLTGAATVAALMTKQNFADVGVFVVVALPLALRQGEITRRRFRRLATGYAAGALACLALVTAWTLLHGTSPGGVFEAMYPFRIEASRVLATSSRQHANARLWLLLLSWLVSAGAIIMAVITRALVSRRLRGTAAWARVATLAFDVVSFLVGGSYWHHYLVQLVVPTSILAGVLVARGQPGIRRVLTAAVAVSGLAVLAVLSSASTSVGSEVGGAVARSAEPGDTIITAWGHPDVDAASGLTSPYPYLWSLPARTLDPRLHDLNRVLRGPAAPTWFVTWTSVGVWGPDSAATAELVASRYHPVAQLHGRTVFLRNGMLRPTPGL